MNKNLNGKKQQYIMQTQTVQHKILKFTRKKKLIITRKLRESWMQSIQLFDVKFERTFSYELGVKMMQSVEKHRITVTPIK